jgi:hypothetical protein
MIIYQFFIEGEIFQTESVDKVNTHILWSITFSENLAVYEIMQRHCTAGQATDDNIIWCMRNAWWLNLQTQAHDK